MVAFTSFISTISMVLLASTATAAPSVEKRDNAAIELTLYAPPADNPLKCWNNAKDIHLRTGDLSKDGLSPCYTVNFSTFLIEGQHGLNCHLNVFDNPTCAFGNIGSYTQVNTCSYFGAIGQPTHMQSAQVSCDPST